MAPTVAHRLARRWTGIVCQALEEKWLLLLEHFIFEVRLGYLSYRDWWRGQSFRITLSLPNAKLTFPCSCGLNLLTWYNNTIQYNTIYFLLKIRSLDPPNLPWSPVRIVHPFQTSPGKYLLRRVGNDKTIMKMADEEVSTRPIFVVDAFTDKPFGGNPAAVCLVGSEVSELLDKWSSRVLEQTLCLSF